MSKNVKILENTAEKILPEVGKIQTQLTNGSKCYWVPEDEIPLGTLTVTQDGVYKASEDPNGPYYGYSQVTASGIGNVEMGNLTELVVTENGVYKASLEEGGPFVGYSKVTINVPQDGSYHPSSGTVGKDDDGDDAIATVDPETGEIKIDKLENGLPVRIEITTPPDYVGPYGNGAYISFEGLVVTAYCENDVPFDTSTTPNGVIPIEQLEFPVTVAQYDPEAGPIVAEVVSELDISPFEYIPVFSSVRTYYEYILIDGVPVKRGPYYTDWRGDYKTMYGYMSGDSRVISSIGASKNLDDPSQYYRAITYNDKTCYMLYDGLSVPYGIEPEVMTIDQAVDRDKIAWSMVYGDTIGYTGGVQIPVLWQLPGSSAKFEVSFAIEVSDVSPSGTND